MKKHIKGSVARAIQEYFLSKPYEQMFGNGSWCWFKIPNNNEFCVALEWQNGYDPNDKKEIYGEFMEKDYVINVSIKLTDEFAINGDYAYYAEYYFNENEDDELFGGCGLTINDKKNGFFSVSKWLADDFNKFNRMTRRR